MASDPPPVALDALLWTALAGAALLVGLWMAWLGFTIRLGHSELPVVVAGAGAGMLARWPRRAWPPMVLRAARTLDGVALFIGLSLVGTLATYCAAASAVPWADPLLAGADAALGFDWPAAYARVAASPVLQWIGSVAYKSIFPMPVLVLLALGATGRHDRACRFLAGHALALAVAVALFAALPARSAMIHHLGPDTSYLPAAGVQYLVVLEGVRAGVFAPIALDGLQGIITFPSFHATTAVLLCWAAWPLGGAARWATIAVNALMLAATPVEGMHYLVDVIAGLALALATIAVVRPRAQSAATDSTTLPTWSPLSR